MDPDNTGYSDTQPELAYVAGTPLVAWVRDQDRDLTTLNDHNRIYRLNDQGERVAAGSSADGQAALV